MSEAAREEVVMQRSRTFLRECWVLNDLKSRGNGTPHTVRAGWMIFTTTEAEAKTGVDLERGVERREEGGREELVPETLAM